MSIDDRLWLAYQLGKATAAMPAPNHEEEMAKVKSDVEGLMGYGFMVDSRRVGLDRIVWFNRPGEQSLHARPLPDNDEAIQDEFNEWIGPRRSGESPQEAAVLYWAQEAYRAGRLAAPVVPVAAQPNYAIKSTGSIPVEFDGIKIQPTAHIPQYPAYAWIDDFTNAAPHIEAQPAVEVVRDAARYQFFVENFNLHFTASDAIYDRSSLGPSATITDAIDAAMTQGDKA